MREQAPGATATHHIEESVEDLAQRVHPRAPGSPRGGEVGLDQDLLGAGEIGLVCSSDHARYPTGPPLHDPFSDGFSSAGEERVARVRNRIALRFSCHQEGDD